MGKISDIWVRLGLKKEGFDKGMDDAGKKAEGFGARLKKMKAGAVAIWAAIGSAVVAFAKDFIRHTNMIGDAWEQRMSGIKASYHSVIADMSNYKPDFSSFRAFFQNEWNWIKKTFSNAGDAKKAAQEMTKAFDAEFELVNSVKLQRQQVQQELNELQIKMRDVTLSPSDRQAAAQKYKALLQPIADAEVKVYSNMLSKAVQAWQAGNNLDREYSTEELTEFFSKIGTEYEKMQAKFPDLMRVYETRKGDTQNQIIFDTISKLQVAANQMSEIDRLLSRTTNSINAKLHVDDPHKIASELSKKMAQDYASINRELGAAIDTEAFFEDIDMSAVDNEMTAFLDNWKTNVDEIVALNGMLEQSFVSSMSGGLQALTDMMMGIEGADASQVLSALLEPFADTATQLGEMLVLQGLGITAFKESLKTLNGPVAIAAGVALMALGSAMKSGIKALANGPQGATSATTGVASSAGEAQLYESEITINVVGKISGSDIVLAGEKTLNKWNR